MGAPWYKNLSSVVGATTGNASVAIPGGTDVGDFLLLVVENSAASTAVATPTSGGGAGDPWTQIGTPVATSTTGATITRLALYWKWATSNDTTNTTVAVTTDHVICSMYAFNNVNRTSPINTTGATGNSGSTAVSSITYPTITTTAANCLVIAVVATGWDATTLPLADDFANANLTEIRVAPERSMNIGNGGGAQVSMGVKETAGATGSSTENLTAGSTMQVAYRQFALAPDISDSCGMLVGSY
jgi:hypothetical protein